MKTHPIQRAAQISECGRYRYQLARWWDETLPRALFVMLNPSSADGVHEDATSTSSTCFCLGMTERGEPRHPLRLASSTALRPCVFEEVK